jgi:hypothetical protein
MAYFRMNLDPLVHRLDCASRMTPLQVKATSTEPIAFYYWRGQSNLRETKSLQPAYMRIFASRKNFTCGFGSLSGVCRKG